MRENGDTIDNPEVIIRIGKCWQGCVHNEPPLEEMRSAPLNRFGVYIGAVKFDARIVTHQPGDRAPASATKIQNSVSGIELQTCRSNPLCYPERAPASNFQEFTNGM